MQKKKVLSTLAAAFLFSSTLGFVSVDGPGPNDDNGYGLCTAYFNGQKKGHDNPNAGGKGNGNGRQPGEAPGPFQGLEEAAEAAEMSVYDYCQQYGIGGNPENGRFPECFDGDENTGNDACPSDD